MEKTNITIQVTVKVPIELVWKYWISPEHIIHWNYASDDWHTPRASINLRNGGTFSYRMEAKDGSFGFDFDGTFDKVIPNRLIQYTIADGRKVNIVFSIAGDSTEVLETFEAESTHSIEQQKEGWQAILNNFKKYAENRTH